MKKHKDFELITANVKTPKLAIASSIMFCFIYLSWWLNIKNSKDVFLYTLLVIGEIYHVWQALGYSFTIWNLKKPKLMPITKHRTVDIFITVCGEPVDIVEKTVKAAINLNYPKDKFKVYVLNDGLVAKKANYKEIDEMAIRNGAIPITRTIPGGAKAGNINNALAQTMSDLFAVFDADHIPNKEFLNRTVGYFDNQKLAFVQTPQYYKNNEAKYLTQGAWEQQELFFGPIMRGKNNYKVAFWCGTNALIRRKALQSVGKIPEDNIAEDFLVSLFMHQKGWESVYVPEILAEGMAPHNLQEYCKQQYRWARGSLEIMFKHNPIFKKGLTISQKLQYLYSSSYYLNGIIVLIDALIPLYVLTTGKIPVTDEHGTFLLVFFPFILSTIYLLVSSTHHLITFRAIQLSNGLFYVFIKALLSTVFGFKAEFKVTSKEDEEGNYLKYALPHIIYTATALSIVAYHAIIHGVTPNLLNNLSWILFNIFLFGGFIKAAYQWHKIFNKTFLKNLLIFTRKKYSPVPVVNKTKI